MVAHGCWIGCGVVVCAVVWRSRSGPCAAACRTHLNLENAPPPPCHGYPHWAGVATLPRSWSWMSTWKWCLRPSRRLLRRHAAYPPANPRPTTSCRGVAPHLAPGWQWVQETPLPAPSRRLVGAALCRFLLPRPRPRPSTPFSLPLSRLIFLYPSSLGVPRASRGPVRFHG
jgi:hypothetical protein